jgi:sugar/nucleoside kinase (ribokinase family)
MTDAVIEIKKLRSHSSYSPNAEESLSLLSIPLPPTPSKIEQAASTFLSYGLRKSGKEGAIIRSGALGAYVLDAQGKGKWIEAYWKGEEVTENIVDVTGAGNAFLGGLSAGLKLSSGDIFEGDS